MRSAEVTAQYFQAVLNALREVDDALSALDLVGRQVAALVSLYRALGGRWKAPEAQAATPAQ